MKGTTQGDPLAMVMYTLAVTPLIDQLKASCPEVRSNRTPTLLLHWEGPIGPSHSSWRSRYMQSFSHVIRVLPIITASLIALIISHDPANIIDSNTMVILKSDTKKRNRQLQHEQAQAIYDQLSPDLQRCMELSSEKGSSSWLSVLHWKNMVSTCTKGNSGMHFG